jgi:hypothetical protein
VLLVEKRQEIGAPVRCAEGVSRAGLEKFVPIDPKWICAQIHGYRFHAPDGASFTVEPDGIGTFLRERSLTATWPTWPLTRGRMSWRKQPLETCCAMRMAR